VSFFASAIIPDEVRPRYVDNLISGLAMNLVGPVSLRLVFQGFVVVVGFLMLAGAVNTSIVGSNGVLNRVSEDGVLDAIAQTAVCLRATEIVAGGSEVLSQVTQSLLMGDAWDRTPHERGLAPQSVIHISDDHVLRYSLGAHAPALSTDDVERIHRVWVKAVKAGGPQVHRRGGARKDPGRTLRSEAARHEHAGDRRARGLPRGARAVGHGDHRALGSRLRRSGRLSARGR
jgi:hypothetical protein